MSEQPTDSIEQYESINEFAIIGEFGVQRVPGPFDVVKDGTVWDITVPTDAHATVTTLPHQKGERAALVADAEIVGGGVVIDVVEVDDDKLHVLVDQYAQGNPSINARLTDMGDESGEECARCGEPATHKVRFEDGDTLLACGDCLDLAKDLNGEVIK